MVILSYYLKPFMDNDGNFQDDNVSCHWAQIVRNWFEERSGQFQRMVWLPRSPDMNPIKIYGTGLKGDFRQLVESIPCRVATLRWAKGGLT
ncbi:hypothetical protein AVEN_63975-1 [Araneus ventricosus]|uniref:Tc1-like transposase DDE domain-containing protein n=1 Tax=Araneus ventricosus TaxID=182803 RepID=A0A4Y2KA93_ARAVE|nr:hypothetical protein AVEN_63975-1 [Araneus ventricosus]